ncbi:MAG: 30S ribosomal protein S20 [Oligoflexia bacterium]|nr:30S ribosomal protein S20 [Oligoflexia bacterium]
MATHISAEKRARQTKRRTVRNDTISSSLKTFEKKVRAAYEAKDGKAAIEALKNFAAQFDKAASKGIVHVKKAARKVGRLSKLVSSLKS